MDSSTISWLSEMGLDNPVFTDQFGIMDSFDDELAALVGVQQEYFDSSSSSSSSCLNSWSSTSTLINNIPSTNSVTSFSLEPPPKHQKPNSFSTLIQGDRSSSSSTTTPIILNFGNPNSPQPAAANQEAAVVSADMMNKSWCEGGVKKSACRMKPAAAAAAAAQTYDHIIAERKRREQLSQRFVALSTIVPGLKKMDKTSVLGDTIKYLKYLQERVKILEEQSRKKTMESVVLVKKSQANMEEKSPSPDVEEQPLPEIEARVCNSQILIRVHCENNQKGLLANLIGKVDKLNLTIVYTNVASFGRFALDITIITEMEKEFNLTVNEVVKSVRAALQDIL